MKIAKAKEFVAKHFKVIVAVQTALIAISLIAYYFRRQVAAPMTFSTKVDENYEIHAIEQMVLAKDLLKLLRNMFDPKDVKLGKVLGKGAFGAAYRATHRKLTGLCGVVMKKMVAKKKDGQPVDPKKKEAKMLKSYLKEVKNMMNVVSPLAPSLYRANLVRQPFQAQMYMEMVGAGSLKSLWKKSRLEMSDDVLKTIAAQLLMSLLTLQSENVSIVHSDIKPDNIFVGCNGVAILGDLGLAHREEGDLSGLDGTPSYASPESIQCLVDSSKPCESTFMHDIWGVGVSIYVMHLGHNPMTIDLDKLSDNEHDQAMYKRIMSFRMDCPSGMSKGMCSLLTGLLQVDPTKRWNVKKAMECEWFSGLDWADTMVHGHDKVVSAVHSENPNCKGRVPRNPSTLDSFLFNNFNFYL